MKIVKWACSSIRKVRVHPSFLLYLVLCLIICNLFSENLWYHLMDSNSKIAMGHIILCYEICIFKCNEKIWKRFAALIWFSRIWNFYQLIPVARLDCRPNTYNVVIRFPFSSSSLWHSRLGLNLNFEYKWEPVEYFMITAVASYLR